MKINYIVWFAIIIHIAWGLMLLISPDPLNTTAIYSSNFTEANHQLYGMMYIIIALMALFSDQVNNFILSVAMLVPQQVVMVLSSLGAMNCIINSAYADGVIRPGLFIAADQLSNILATILHTIALLFYVIKRKW